MSWIRRFADWLTLLLVVVTALLALNVTGALWEITHRLDTLKQSLDEVAFWTSKLAGSPATGRAAGPVSGGGNTTGGAGPGTGGGRPQPQTPEAIAAMRATAKQEIEDWQQWLNAHPEAGGGTAPGPGGGTAPGPAETTKE